MTASLFTLFLFVTQSFTGLVREIRAVELLGYPATVARIQSDHFSAWVILQLDTVTLGHAQVGEQVQVSIRGPHVFRDRVDWTACQPADSDYCRWGALYEDAPLALEWDAPFSPSNEFLHYGHPNPHYSQALYWNTTTLPQPRLTLETR